MDHSASTLKVSAVNPTATTADIISLTIHRRDIDGLRAIAVTSVILFHVGVPGFSGGFVGVDIFFVISGYLITGILIRQIDGGALSLGQFYERRIRRIAPALVAMMLATSLAAALLLTPAALSAYGKSLAAATLSASNLYFWKTSGYFDLQATQAPLLHTWSLAVEEQFYLVVPLYLAWMHKRTGVWIKVIAPIVLLSFAIQLAMIGSSENAAFYLPFGRFWEPGLGALLSVVAPASRRLRRLGLHDAAAALGLAAIVASVHAFDEAMDFPGYAALLPCMGAALLIFANEGGGTVVGRALSCQPLRFLGLISYSLYLWHWPVLVFYRMLLPGGANWHGTLAVLLATFALSVLSWRYVETPFRRPRRSGGTWPGRSTERPRLFIASGLAALGLVALSGALWMLSGASLRIRPQARPFRAAQNDINPDRAACDSPSVARIAAGKVCRLGAPGGPTRVALLGDSFADALAPGVVAAASAAGERVAIFSHAGCRPYAGVVSEGTCRQRAEASIRAIATDPDITTVLYAQRWSAHIEGFRFGAIRQPAKYMRDDLTTTPGLKENVRVFHRSLERTIKALGHKRIVIVTGMPEQDVVVPDNAFARAQLGLAPPAGVTVQAYRQRRARTDAALRRDQARLGFEIVDLGTAMCGTTHCPVIDSHGARYVDDNHPSRTEALRLRALFQPFF